MSPTIRAMLPESRRPSVSWPKSESIPTVKRKAVYTAMPPRYGTASPCVFNFPSGLSTMPICRAAFRISGVKHNAKKKLSMNAAAYCIISAYRNNCSGGHRPTLESEVRTGTSKTTIYYDGPRKCLLDRRSLNDDLHCDNHIDP